MPKALTEEQADKILPRVKREQARLEARENEALEELHRLGFRVSLHTMGRYVEADDLLGIRAGYKPGNAYAVMYDRSGKRKHVAGTCALEALGQAQAWCRWQAGLKDDAAAKFFPSIDHEPVAVTVEQRVSGDSAQTRQRRENTERRIIGMAGGTAQLVDSHGDPIHEGNQASQYATSESETTR
jgi:hypothetical protein